MSEIAEMSGNGGGVPATRSEREGIGTALAGDGRQFVIFHVEREMFAIPLAEVQEIIRMPELVGVPLSPAALEGLANLRGSVLPVIRLRHVFGMDSVLHDDSTRVVVLDQEPPVGLVVDRVANVTTIEPDRIESSGTVEGTVDTELLTGMIKGDEGRSMVMILNAACQSGIYLHFISFGPIGQVLELVGIFRDELSCSM